MKTHEPCGANRRLAGNAADLVFVDESGCHTSLHSLYGWAPRGERVDAQVPRNRGQNMTILGALSLDTWQALTIEGAADRVSFEAFIEQVLVPTLRPGQIVILDNLNVHKSAKAQALVERAGCRWVFLPTYSPDLNPIEMMWSKLKHFLRCIGPRTNDLLDQAITQGLFTVTPQNAVGWFAHAGYTTSQLL